MKGSNWLKASDRHLFGVFLSFSVALALPNVTQADWGRSLYAKAQAASSSDVNTDSDGDGIAVAEKLVAGNHGYADAEILDEGVGRGYSLRTRAVAEHVPCCGAGATARAELADQVKAFADVRVANSVFHSLVIVDIGGTLEATGPSPPDGSATASIFASARASLPGVIPYKEYSNHADQGHFIGVHTSLILEVNNNMFVDHMPIDLILESNAATLGRFENHVNSHFASTMKIASFTFLDINGRFVDGITVIADSGASYPVNAVVPEPSSAALLAANAVLAMLTIRRSKPTSHDRV